MVYRKMLHLRGRTSEAPVRDFHTTLLEPLSFEERAKLEVAAARQPFGSGAAYVASVTG